MTPLPNNDIIHAQYTNLLKRLEEKRDRRAETSTTLAKLRKGVRELTHPFDSILADKLSDDERSALAKACRESSALVQSSLSTLKKDSLKADRGGRSRRQSIVNAWRSLHKSPPAPDPQFDPAVVASPWLLWYFQHSIRHGELTPPAYGCGPTLDQNTACFPDTGVLKLFEKITGEGTGLDAQVGDPGVEASMVFIYFPEIEGILNATANVRLFGTVMVHAVDHWYSRSDADLELDLFCSISQTGMYAENSTTVVKQHRGDSTFFQAFDEVLQAPCTGYVLPDPDNPVFITVGASSTAGATSDDDTVEVDFSSHDPEKFLHIESIDISLDPAP